MKLFNVLTTDGKAVLINPYEIKYCDADLSLKETNIYMRDGKIFTTKSDMKTISKLSNDGFSFDVSQ